MTRSERRGRTSPQAAGHGIRTLASFIRPGPTRITRQSWMASLMPRPASNWFGGANPLSLAHRMTCSHPITPWHSRAPVKNQKPGRKRLKPS